LWQEHLATTGEPEKPRRRGFIMGGMGAGGGDTMALQALLAEMSGLKKPRGFLNRFVRRLLGMRPKPPPKYRMLIMMATNMPSSLDQALLRPGRIDRIYKVGYPSKEGRTRTFNGYLSKVKHELTEEQVEKLAVISPYATGATIKDTVNEALVYAIRDGRDTITWPDVLKAKHHKEHGLPDDTEYIDRERHAVAIHEACHAIAFYRLDKAAAIDVATIERRGDVGGFVAPIPLEDQFFTWKSERENDIMISLASLAGERLFFDGDNSAGVGGDLRQATTVAMQMEAFSGMGSTVASHSVTKAVAAQQLGQSVETGTDRQWLETPFGERVETRLDDLLRRVAKLLTADRIWVLALAHAMEHRKTISGEDVEAIMTGTVGPTIDGRLYHDRKIQGELEDYHRAALVAHKEVSKPKIPFPTFNGEGKVHDVVSDVTALVDGNEENGEDVAVAEPVAAARTVSKRVTTRSQPTKKPAVRKRAANGRNGGAKGNGRKRA
jgi:cell division protease FtsH